jgi:hypothetical protein
MSETDSYIDAIVWNSSIEQLLARWCDQSKCFEWMHSQAYSYYNKKARIIMIISNLLTAINGLSNIIIGGETTNNFKLAWIFGSISILVTMANMLQEKLAYGQLATKFSQYSDHWGNIRRKIEEQLCIPPKSRQHCGTFLKYIKQDINLVSTAGNSKIPEFIKMMCYSKFNSIPEFDVPDICGQVEHTQIYINDGNLTNYGSINNDKKNGLQLSNKEDEKINASDT